MHDASEACWRFMQAAVKDAMVMTRCHSSAAVSIIGHLDIKLLFYDSLHAWLLVILQLNSRKHIWTVSWAVQLCVGTQCGSVRFKVRVSAVQSKRFKPT
jgi:hypothetical protein